MRALSACLVAVLALGVAAVTACSSSSSDDSSTGGTGGTTADTGGTGGTTAGGTGGSTATGDGGAMCVLDNPSCGDCIGTKCGTEATTCTSDEINGCDQAFTALTACVCSGTSTLSDCEATFREDGGSNAKALADCFDTNCAANCQ